MEVKRNGGFPEPPAGEAVRLVLCHHDACGAATRVRLPRELAARAVRRVVCDGCREPFECAHVLDVGVAYPARPNANHQPGRHFGTEGHAWRYLSVPVAGGLVIAALAVIQRLG